MEGLEGRPPEPFSFRCRPELRYCRIPHFGKPRSMTPLENNSSELWPALKSPLLSTKDSLQCHAKPPNEHYKSCKHFTLNNDTQRERQKQFTTWILAGWLIGLTSQINMQYICKFEKKKCKEKLPFYWRTHIHGGVHPPPFLWPLLKVLRFTPGQRCSMCAFLNHRPSTAWASLRKKHSTLTISYTQM